jgi:hypothetical protein
MSDFDVVGHDADDLRARLSGALAATGDRPAEDAALASLVQAAFVKWMVD